MTPLSPAVVLASIPVIAFLAMAFDLLADVIAARLNAWAENRRTMK